MNNVTVLNFQTIGDSNGKLIPIENNKHIPFEIKRVYYIFDTKTGVRRGFHAHINLEQILICISGGCKVLCDDGHQKQIIELNTRDKGLYLKDLIWREMFDFSDDCVLMVLASDVYKETDYIRNYNEFLAMIK